ncbi:MAG: amidohydrolase family protein, partial [Acidimicrobiia bacterium]|nr:amidohydrolase family protein [Acidimicrobiia bacterium]
MNTLLIRNAHRLVVMDGTHDAIGTELADGAIFARNGWIERVGPTSKLPTHAHRVIDARGKVVLPGFVNTHHHLYQTMTRAVFGAESSGLFDWLKTLYPIWNRMTPDHVRVATTLGLAELALTGCTTAFDHQYMWPNGSSIDDQFEGAKRVGIRFHASRGSMSVGETSGGLPPDSVVEEEGTILRACEDAVEDHHDPRPGSMRQVAIAPCSPFSVSTKLMTASAEMARRLNVRLHTHLAETVDEEAYCLEQFGARPIEYAESVGWLGEDAWFAHGVHVAGDEITELARTGTGVAHCPTSNMRLASGLAPLLRYLEAGVPVGLGVDGLASNDSSNMLAEARMAMLCARLSTTPGIGEPADQLSARAA